MSDFGTETDQMVATAAQIDQVSQSVAGQLQQLMNQIEPLGAEWKGLAANAFQNLIQRWNADAVKLTQALSEISDMMKQSGTNYANNEQNVQSSIAGILGGIS